MAIPRFQEFMLPVLEFLKDGKDHHKREINQHISELFKLTDTDKVETIQNGKQLLYKNRIAWALTYLKHAGLLKSSKQAIYGITQEGRKVLEKKLERIDKRFLLNYPEFVSFLNLKSDNLLEVKAKESTEKDDIETVVSDDPQEMIENGYQIILNGLYKEILDKVKSCSFRFFEVLVVELLLKMGYGGSIKDAGKAIGQSGDGGIDGIIKEDKLGLDVIYIQAKRWENTVGRPDIQKFVGSLVGNHANKGVFITTSSFSKDAIDFVKTIQHKVILIDGVMLSQYMVDYDLGVTKVISYDIKRIDSDYFVEE
jgi:restriction system protein